jgi:hypothetical protein
MMIGTTTATKRLFSSVFLLASARPSITSAFTTTAVLSPFRVSASSTTSQRMSTSAAAAAAAATSSSESTTATATATSNDPHKFLEDVLGDKSLEWVKTQNDNCIAKYGDPTTTENSDYQRILDILDSKDKIPVRIL